MKEKNRKEKKGNERKKENGKWNEKRKTYLCQSNRYTAQDDRGNAFMFIDCSNQVFTEVSSSQSGQSFKIVSM